MKKLLKENSGFSLVELLVALLIMAVIAGTAITLFGGVLETSKGRADRETAENIKRAILTYVNASGDSNLSALGVDSGVTESEALLCALASQITISTDSDGDRSTEFDCDASDNDRYSGYDTPEAILDGEIDDTDLDGIYGPFLDVTKNPAPTQNGMEGWIIKVNQVSQAITVEPKADSDECKVTVN